MYIFNSLRVWLHDDSRDAEMNTIDAVLSSLVIGLKIKNKTDKRLIEAGLKNAFAMGELKQSRKARERS